MRTFGVLLTASLVVGGLGMAAMGAPAATNPAPAAKMPVDQKAIDAKNSIGPLAQQFSQMGYQLKLSPEQKVKIQEQTDAMIDELVAFRTEAIKRMKDAAAAIEPTIGAEREKLRQAMTADVAKTLADYQDLLAKHQAEINASLTPEQRVAWETFKINRSLTGLFRLGPPLSDAQKKQMKPMVDGTAKELAESKDGASTLMVYGKLLKQLVAEVFTDEQSGHICMNGAPALSGLPGVPLPKGGAGGDKGGMTSAEKDLP